MDRDADFAAFVDARWGVLVRSVVLLGASPAEAEDVTQTTLETCLRSWDTVRKARDLDAYVYRMLVHTFVRGRKRRWWGEQPTEQLPEPSETASSDPEQQTVLLVTVLSALARLSPEHREVLVLRFYADLSEQQAAEVLGVAVGTVKSRTARALAQTATDPALARLFDREEA